MVGKYLLDMQREQKCHKDFEKLNAVLVVFSYHSEKHNFLDIHKHSIKTLLAGITAEGCYTHYTEANFAQSPNVQIETGKVAPQTKLHSASETKPCFGTTTP